MRRRRRHSSGISIAGGGSRRLLWMSRPAVAARCVLRPATSRICAPRRLEQRRRPAPVTAEMRKTAGSARVARAASGAIGISSVTASILFAATSCGLAASVG